MDFNELYLIKDELEQINKTYEIFNEDIRLNRSKAARVEFLTTVRYIEKYLKPGDKILDIGAGAGEYSLYFANKGHCISAVELSDNNIAAFSKKIQPQHDIDLYQGNAVDLSLYESNSFDVVLLFGPLYHLHNESDRQKCISEAKRVCKPSGKLFFAFISNDMVIATELSWNPKYLEENTYDHETFKVEDFPFVFFTVDVCRKMLLDGGIKIFHEVASDGLSELMAEQINSLSDEGYSQYLKYHFYCCEKPEMLGRSNHLLFVGEK
ncbi:MAG: class I SAM-dependent methyltransferase [Ruminococcaceae bacterium]|nr:class I SAM-dependent methyltransferase [Oscillospiraceae bacterium]